MLALYGAAVLSNPSPHECVAMALRRLLHSSVSCVFPPEPTARERELGKRIDERADFGALRNGIAACVVAIHCVHALYTASVAGEVKGHFISPHNGIHNNLLIDCACASSFDDCAANAVGRSFIPYGDTCMLLHAYILAPWGK